MIIKKEFYQKIYRINNSQDLKEKEMQDLLMCSSRNWDFYFFDIQKINTKRIDIEEDTNVEFIEFDTKDAMLLFWDSIKDKQKIDWSNEHEYPCILKYSSNKNETTP